MILLIIQESNGCNIIHLAALPNLHIVKRGSKIKFQDKSNRKIKILFYANHQFYLR